jgi:hypothetical protein
MATFQSILDFARAQSQTDSIGLSDANGIIFANEANADFHRRLISHQIDASSTVEAYCDGQANVGTYLYPSDLFFLKAIELNYTDTQPTNYQRADQIDVSNLPAEKSFSWWRKNADKMSPNFDDRGDWYEIFPTPQSSDNLSQLIRLFYFASPTEFSSTSDILTYPVTLDYRILGWRIASNYYYSIGKIPEGDKYDAKYQERVTELISTLGRGTQQPIQVVPIQLSGFEF